VLQSPIRNIVPNLVYAASGHEVELVMVAGRVLVQQRRVLTADEAAIRDEAQTLAEQVARRVAEDPLHHELALLEPMRRGWL